MVRPELTKGSANLLSMRVSVDARHELREFFGAADDGNVENGAQNSIDPRGTVSRSRELIPEKNLGRRRNALTPFISRRSRRRILFRVLEPGISQKESTIFLRLAKPATISASEPPIRPTCAASPNPTVATGCD